MPLLLFGLLALIGFVLIGRWFLSAEPKSIVRALRITGIVLGIGLVLALAVTGRLPVALGLAAMLLPMLFRWRAMANRFKAARGPSPGQRSSLRTATLETDLDHDSGAMDGTVLRGRFVGRRLSDLALEEVMALLADCQADDTQSVAILHAYLDRRFGPDWRDGGATGDAGGQAGPRPSGGRMSRDEAYAILGLEAGADAAAIKAAHRRLMKKFHPDQGGSDYFAAKLNEAKDVLLGS